MRGMIGAAALAAALALPGAAPAATFTGAWTVTHNAADPGLAVKVAGATGGGTTPDLAVGESFTFDLFRIWTDESDVGPGEDDRPSPISVRFAFSDPVVDGVMQGATRGGRDGFLGKVRQGHLDWDGPLTLAFGHGGSGQLTLSLTDRLFNTGLFGLTEGAAHGAVVKATLTYDRAPAPVPLPAALPLLAAGIGALGLAARRRSRAAAPANV